MTCLVLVVIAAAMLAQDTPQFSTTSNLVVVNVSVAGRDGQPIENLKKEDFVLLEDGKRQALEVFELQRLSGKPLPTLESAPALIDRSAPATTMPHPAAKPANTVESYRDHRLMVLLFDFSSMQPAEQQRSVTNAVKFLSEQMTASDMVSIMVLGNELKTVQDFTGDRDLLVSAIKRFRIGESSENAGMAATGADAEDVSGQFVADDTEFNIFNTDRKLTALEDAARRLAVYPEKKALVYFSSGVEKTGVDNQSQLRSTVNTAVRSNVAFYPIDARGLTASSPGGDATQAGGAGSSLFSGRAQRSLSDSFQNQQETLYSLAADTGGKAMLDSNDLTVGIRQVQKDINSYYTLGYRPANVAEDGRYRKIQVKLVPRLTAMKLKLDYRQGYFGPTTFAKTNAADKEAQLQQALNSENPSTALPLAVEVDFFRMSKSKYFVPVSVKLPGSALAFRNKGAKAATELDFIGEVKDAQDRPVSVVRDTIPLKLQETTARQVTQKQVQYDTGFTLAPGKYKLRFVARENGEGKTGTFETAFRVPDLAGGAALRVSSVILSNQKEAGTQQQIASVKTGKKLIAQNPLIDETGSKIVPNITRVFRPEQSLFVYFEVYDSSVPTSLSANLALYKDDQKLLETPAVRVNRLSAKRAGALTVGLQTRLKDVQPGQYVCQVNIIDEMGHKFAFPRMQLVVLPHTTVAAP